MASLLNWLEGAFAQVNPFDNGEDYGSVMRRKQREEQQRRVQQPQQPQPRPQPQQRAPFAQPQARQDFTQPQAPALQPSNTPASQSRNSVINRPNNLRIGDFEYTKNPDGSFTEVKSGAKRTPEMIKRLQQIEGQFQERQNKINSDQAWGTVGDIVSAPVKVGLGIGKGATDLATGQVGDWGNRVADFGNAAAEVAREATGENQRAFEQQQKTSAEYMRMANSFMQRANNARTPAEKQRYIDQARSLWSASDEVMGQAQNDINRGLEATDPMKTISTAGMTALDLATLGKGKLILDGVKLGQKVTGQSLKTLGKNILVSGGQGAGIGGAYGGLATMQDPNATPLDYARNMGTGALLGAGAGVGAQIALPVAGVVSKKAIDSGVKGAQVAKTAANNARPSVIARQDPRVVGYDDAILQLQQRFDSEPNTLVRHQLNQAIAAARQEQAATFNQVKRELTQGGFVAGPLAADFKGAKARGEVFDGVDGKPRFEVDDSGAKIKSITGTKLGEVLDHPELYKNYPEAKNIDVKLAATQASSFDGKTLTLSAFDKDPKGTILHEVQHYIQNNENFARGGAPKSFRPDDVAAYKKLAGEAEARAVQARMNMPMSERYVKPERKRPQPTDNDFQNTLPSGSRPESIKNIVKNGGNPLYHDTNSKGVLGILESGEIRTSQAPFSQIAGQGKRVSTTRNFDNYSRYGKSPYRFVIDERKTGQKAIPDNREEFESIFKKPVSTKSVESVAIDITNPELINDIQNGTLKKVIEAAKAKGVKVEVFEGKLLPDVQANKEIQEMTKSLFSKEFPDLAPTPTPRSTFYDSLDVPKEDLIIRNGDGKAMSVEPKKKPGATQEAQIGRLSAKQKTSGKEQPTVLKESPQSLLDSSQGVRRASSQDIGKSVPKRELANQSSRAAPLAKDNLGQSPLDTNIPQKREIVDDNRRVIKSGETTGYKLRESFEKSDNVPQDLKDSIGAFGNERTVRSNKELWQTAQKRVFDDPEDAIRYFKENANDDSVATGYALINRYMKQGKTKQAGEIAQEMSERALKAGRATQAYAIMRRLTPEGSIAYVEKKVARYKQQNPKKADKLDWNDETRTELYDMAKKVNKMDEGVDRNIVIGMMNERINNIFPSSLTDKALAVWKAGLLSSFRTHERNLLGNTINLASEQATTLPASLIDRLMATRTGQRSIATSLGEGYISGVRTGARNAKIQATTGIDVTGDALKYSENHVTWGKGRVEQFLKKSTGAVFNTLGAEDKLFKGIAYDSSIHNQALVSAMNKKLKGKAFDEYADNLTKNPTAKMKEVAQREAEIATFSQENVISSAARSLKRGIGKTPLGKVVTETTMPFTQVPGGVAVQLYNYTPLAGMKSLYDVAKVMITKDTTLQRTAAQGIGRSAIGTAILGAGAYLASKGLMTGQPRDDAEKAQWEAEGKTPNSIKVGDRWYSLGSIGPQNLLLLAGAQYVQNTKKKDGNPIAETGFGMLKNFKDQTFLKGMSSVLDAADDPGRYGDFWMESMVTSTIPNVLKDVARATDPSQREAVGIADKLKSGIPGLSTALPKRRDAYGQEMNNSGALELIDLFNSNQGKDVPEAKFVEALRDSTGLTEHIPTKADRSIKINGETKKLNSEELAKYQEYIGTKGKNFIGRAMNDQSFKKLSGEEQVKKIDSALQDINAAAKIELFGNKTKNVPKSVADIVNSGSAKVTSSHIGGRVSISDRITGESRGTLETYYSMDADKRESWFAEKNDNEYKYYKAKYENDKANGEISDIEDVKRKRYLYKDKVGAKFSKDTRDLYSLSKADIATYLSKAKNGEKIAEELLKYDRALYDAGLSKYMKFRYGFGSSSGRKGSGRGGSRATGVTEAKARVALARKLNKMKAPATSARQEKPSVSKAEYKKTPLRKYTVTKAGKTGQPLRITTRKA